MGYVLLGMSILTFVYGAIIISWWGNELSHLKPCTGSFAVLYMYTHSILYVMFFAYPVFILILALFYKGGAILFLLKCPRAYERLFFERDSKEVRECMDMIWNLDWDNSNSSEKKWNIKLQHMSKDVEIEEDDINQK